MEWQTRVRVKESKRVHPALWGAEGKVLYHCLQDVIVMVMFDKAIDGPPTGGYGARFHSVAVDALEVIDAKNA